LATGVLVLLAGCGDDAFACDQDSQCEGTMAGGQCELNGYCSFLDPECPSGRRYGDLAGGGVAGLCVVGESGTTGGPASTGPDISQPPAEGSSAGDTLGVDTGVDTTAGASDGPMQTGGTSGSTGSSVDDGLLLWLEFEKFDEAGGVVFDSSGNGHDASCAQTSCPILAEGRVGAAAVFDGASFLQVAHDPAFDVVDALTLAVWIRMSAPPARAFAGVVGKSFGDASLNSYELYHTGMSGSLRFNMDAGTSGSASYPIGIKPTGWVHIAGTWDGDQMRLYVDGELYDSAVTKRPPSHEAVPLLIGADLNRGVPSRFWEGAIDELRVYNRELDASEVAALAAEGS